jgi:mxaA protein
MPSRAISTVEARAPCLAGWQMALAGWLTALACHSVFAQGTLSAQSQEPRAFGYFVGDVLQRRVQLSVPAGLVLDVNSLPRTRRPGQALELRRVQWQGGPELLLEYQVFMAPTEVRTLEAPPLKLRFTGGSGVGGGEQFLRVEAWPVTVAPLVPADVSPRTGLGELRPDAAPPLLETAPTQQRLWAYGALLALACAYLVNVYVGLPWLGRRQRPFAQAFRELQAMPPAASAQQLRAAYERLHTALNASAGEVLFVSGLNRYLAAQPNYAPLRDELAAFFARSSASFFAGQDVGGDGPALLKLSQALRNAERGS